MPEVRLENLPASHTTNYCRLIDPPARVGKKSNRRCSRAEELIAELLEGRDPPDENERRCFDLIRRFHRWSWRDTIRALRFVTVPVIDRTGTPCSTTNNQPLSVRVVLELACFPSPEGSTWSLGPRPLSC